MKCCSLLRLGLSLLLVGCEEEGPGPPGDPVPPGEPYNFLTLNLSCDDCRNEDWNLRLLQAGALIGETEPDIVAVLGLVDTAQVYELTALTKLSARFVGDSKWKGVEDTPFVDSLLLYRINRFPRTTAGARWLSPTPTEPYSKFDDQDVARVQLSVSFEDALKYRLVRVFSENLSGVAAEHIPTETQSRCHSGPRGVVLPFALGDERFEQVGLAPNNALELAETVTLDPSYDQPGALDSVHEAVLIDYDGDGPCNQVYSARVLPTPWGGAAVLVKTRENWFD